MQTIVVQIWEVLVLERLEECMQSQGRACESSTSHVGQQELQPNQYQALTFVTQAQDTGQNGPYDISKGKTDRTWSNTSKFSQLEDLDSICLAPTTQWPVRRVG